MRFAVLAGLLLFAACGDDHPNDGHSHGGGGKGGSGGKPSVDAGVTDGGKQPESKLESPGSLSRPPTVGLPAELRPPR